MPDGRITRYIPGRGLFVVGFKAPDANVNFIYNSITGTCPVKTDQSKHAKEMVLVSSCVCVPVICILYDGGNFSSNFETTEDGSGNGILLDGGNANTIVCE